MTARHFALKCSGEICQGGLILHFPGLECTLSRHVLKAIVADTFSGVASHCRLAKTFRLGHGVARQLCILISCKFRGMWEVGEPNGWGSQQHNVRATQRCIVMCMLVFELWRVAGAAQLYRESLSQALCGALQEIAEQKLPDLNCSNVDAAMRIVEGTAKNMGITVEQLVAA